MALSSTQFYILEGGEEENKWYYGRVRIFINIDFENPQFKMNYKYERDVEKIRESFEKLHFKVDKPILNKRAKKMKKCFAEDIDYFGCAVIIVFSHGEKDYIYGTDYDEEKDTGKINVYNDLYHKFSGDNKSEMQKCPKVFFNEWCQLPGSSRPPNTKQGTGFHNTAHWLIYNAAMPGYETFVHEDESSYSIQAFCRRLNEFAQTKDLESIFKIVRSDVSKIKIEHNDFSDLFMQPIQHSTLQKKLYLLPEEKVLELRKQKLKNEEKNEEDLLKMEHLKLADSSTQLSLSKQSDEGDKLKLRNYQEELAQLGLQGRNVIIFAPTGSGKTNVAMKIAFEHLAKDPKHRVAFIVNVGHLVDQQAGCFTKFADKNIHVVRMSGAHNLPDTTAPLVRVIQTNQVIVMTVAILLNALQESNEDDRLASICEFSLLIFDECHHCDKNNLYNQLMGYYFKEKNEIRNQKLPQIVGLTASLGAGNASKTEDAIQHILGFCARLDAHKFVNTEVNISDLQIYQNNPTEEIRRAGIRSRDFFNDQLNRLMTRAEAVLDSLICNLDLPNEALNALRPSQPRCNRGGPLYTIYIGNMFNALPYIKDDTIYKGAFACWWFLKVLNRSVILNLLFCSNDAVNFVKRHLNYRDLASSVSCDDDVDELDCNTTTFVEPEPTCEVDKKLRKSLAEMLSNTEGKLGVPQFESENKILATLKDIVVDQFNANSDSRIIIFVKERSFATAMLSYLKTDYVLNSFGSRKLVGSNASSAMEGQTNSQQRDSVKAFQEGEIKILVATAMVEEGLDIGKCNLVIRYASVTNEIAMVQSKGRCRTSDSKYILIVPEHELWLTEKEIVNKLRDEMMKKAIEKINKMSELEYFSAVHQIQETCIILPKMEETNLENDKKNVLEYSYDLHCVCCRAFACSSDSLRLAQGMHRVCLDENLLLQNRIHLNRGDPVVYGKSGNFETVGQFQCAGCRHAWGTLCNIDKVTYPNIGIKNFHFKRAGDGKFIIKPAKKWKEMEQYFSVAPLTTDDVTNRMNGQLGRNFEIRK